MRCLLLLSLLCVPMVFAGAADPRPNILFMIADDWSFPHASAYGDKVVKTPTFDAIAAGGALFKHSYCASPSCTPSRSAILTGQAVHRLKNSGNLWSVLPTEYKIYPELLQAAGYVTGLQQKGWGPGQLDGRKHNPAGPTFKTIKEFMETVPADKPFCFWYGSHDPHRPYNKGSGAASGMKIEDVEVPPFLPDTPEVRSDILDYYLEVQRFDRDCGEILKLLEESGRTGNTIVVMTSDNGMPFPRAKANLYDSGTHMPLAIRWPAKIKGGQVIDSFVSHTDFAPTFLAAVGLPAEPDMTGRSLLPLMTGSATAEELRERETIFFERERHANVREGNLGYPSRAVRTSEFLYIRNLRPDRYPAGDPVLWHSVGPYGDIDASPSKELITQKKQSPEIEKFFRLACEKRPEEELFDLRKDPAQIFNVANDTQYAETKKKLRSALDKWMNSTQDPRTDPANDVFDSYPYSGEPSRRK
ncbi:MAG TPA: sulfatase [Planctomycetota bacterium]|nr:sulfatase [Planctomycetota bacterium]